MDRMKLADAIKASENDLFKTLRHLISIPSLSGDEKAVVEAIKEVMHTLGYDEIIVDGMGNILGRVGEGERVLAFDGHIDTVDVGNIEHWKFDPFLGKEDEQYIYGRGTSDQTGGFVSALYAAAIAKEIGLLNNWQVWVVGSVQEEDCDGLCWQYILNHKVIEPEFVVLTEPTSLGVYRGQRGRMEIKVSTEGISAHGSAPERGSNAIYKMSKLLGEIEKLNDLLKDDAFLGKGTLAVSEIFSTAPSRCAVADGCAISIDRRLTVGETADSAIAEINALEGPSRKVEMYRYNKSSYNGFVPDVPCYFPTWVIPKTHGLVKAMETAHENMQLTKPHTDKWTFSTNGVSIMGMYGIPCVGYGPGDESEAHAANEKIRKKDLLDAVRTYAAFISEIEEGNYV